MRKQNEGQRDNVRPRETDVVLKINLELERVMSLPKVCVSQWADVLNYTPITHHYRGKDRLVQTAKRNKAWKHQLQCTRTTRGALVTL